jgi:hypothetical protein
VYGTLREVGSTKLAKTPDRAAHRLRRRISTPLPIDVITPLDFTVPADATTAFLRLYNGFPANSGKAVYFDHLSLRELVARSARSGPAAPRAV